MAAIASPVVPALALKQATGTQAAQLRKTSQPISAAAANGVPPTEQVSAAYGDSTQVTSDVAEDAQTVITSTVDDTTAVDADGNPITTQPVPEDPVITIPPGENGDPGILPIDPVDGTNGTVTGTDDGTVEAAGKKKPPVFEEPRPRIPINPPSWFKRDVAIAQSALDNVFRDLWRTTDIFQYLNPIIARLNAEDLNRSARNYNAALLTKEDPLAPLVNYRTAIAIPRFPQSLSELEHLADHHQSRAIKILEQLGVHDIHLTADENKVLTSEDPQWEDPVANLGFAVHIAPSSTLKQQLRVAVGLPARPVDVQYLASALQELARF